MRFLVQVLLNGVALLVAANVVPGIHWQGNFFYLFVAGLVFGVINLIVKPIVKLLSLPFIILTLGLFYLVINGLMLMLASYLLDSVQVAGCMPAILGGLLVAAGNWFIGLFGSNKE